MNRIGAGKVLKGIREQNNWTLEYMAGILGTTKQALSRYERGERTPKLTVAAHFADVLGVSLEQLSGQDAIIPQNVRTIESLTAHRIPVVGSVAAGEPIYSEEQDVYTDGPLNADCAVIVHGDSMNPTYLDKDILYIHAQDDIDHDGQVAVIILGDEAAVKHIYRQQDGLLLVSDNPMYAPKRIQPESFDGPVRILGKVIGFTRIYVN